MAHGLWAQGQEVQGQEVDAQGGEASEILARFILELRSKSVTNPAILTAFEHVSREPFFPHLPASLLYQPIFLPLPCGEEAGDVFMLAHLLALCELKSGMDVLEIGTGSGYFTALLAQAGVNVTSLERYRTLIRLAQRALEGVGFSRVNLIQADGLAHFTCETSQFDRIVAHGAVDSVPYSLLDRLKIGGFLIAARQKAEGETRLQRWLKGEEGQVLVSDHGFSRLGLLRRGLPIHL